MTMSKAYEVLTISRNADDAMERAEKLTDKVDQDWSHEATLYTFDDGSVLVVSGPQCNSYADRASADAALSV
jgi:hypothetical protein